MTQRKKYQVLSPDGITISHNTSYYTSLTKAQQALADWIRNYKAQGYYSQACGGGYNRIPLLELSDYCQIITI